MVGPKHHEPVRVSRRHARSIHSEVARVGGDQLLLEPGKLAEPDASLEVAVRVGGIEHDQPHLPLIMNVLRGVTLQRGGVEAMAMRSPTVIQVCRDIFPPTTETACRVWRDWGPAG